MSQITKSSDEKILIETERGEQANRTYHKIRYIAAFDRNICFGTHLAEEEASRDPRRDVNIYLGAERNARTVHTWIEIRDNSSVESVDSIAFVPLTSFNANANLAGASLSRLMYP